MANLKAFFIPFFQNDPFFIFHQKRHSSFSKMKTFREIFKKKCKPCNQTDESKPAIHYKLNPNNYLKHFAKPPTSHFFSFKDFQCSFCGYSDPNRPQFCKILHTWLTLLTWWISLKLIGFFICLKLNMCVFARSGPKLL